jgi:hypothetical protein
MRSLFVNVVAFVMSTMAIVTTGDVSGQSSADPEPQQPFADRLEIFRTKLASGQHLMVAYSPGARTQFLAVDDQIRIVAGEGQQFSAIALNEDHTVALVHMQTYWNSGLWHWKFLVVRDSRDTDGHVEIDESLVTPALQNVEGFRVEPQDLGSIDQFPLVDIYVAEREVAKEWAVIDWHWERWDIKSQKRVKKLTREEAEMAEQKASERGDIFLWNR